MSDKKINKSLEQIRGDWGQYLSLFRNYPDLFIDMITTSDSQFKLFFYQRLMLRVLLRYRRVYFTLTRGSSKSFIEILANYLVAIFYPNTKIMIVAPMKNMSSQIAQANIEAIWNFIPLLKGEVKEYRFEKDYTKITFHNGSVLDCVANSESSRGLRR